MTEKTIARIIRHRVKKWLDSLPEPLRNEVKDHVIVTGGIITSLLLNEKL